MRKLLEARRRRARGRRRALAGEFDTELVEDRVYVLTPKGEVIDLPVGATPLDFAYHVHTEVGHRCRGAKVDGRIVPLDHKLHSGDRVEIMTAKTGEPRRDWLIAANGFLASSRSREKVRNWFHKLDRARNEQAGRELLDKELRRLGAARRRPGAGAREVPRRQRRRPARAGRARRHRARTRSAACCSSTSAPRSAPPAGEPDGGTGRAAARAAQASRLHVEGVGNLLVQSRAAASRCRASRSPVT